MLSSPDKEFILYNNAQKTHMQVPSFMTTASSFRNQKLSSLRNKSCATAIQDKQVTSIDYQICDKSEPINLQCYPKFKSEQSELSNFAKSQLGSSTVMVPKIMQFIEFCNKKILDDELKKRQVTRNRDIQTKIIPKKLQKQAYRITRSNFTLPQMQGNSQMEIDTLNEKLNQNKIDCASVNASPVPKIQLRTPNYQNYTTKQPIRSYDMVFNVKHLIKLQEKRQKEFEDQQQNDPEFQLEIIRRQNQISILMSNTKKLEQLKKASGGILSHINAQDQQAEQIFQNFRQKLDIK